MLPFTCSLTSLRSEKTHFWKEQRTKVISFKLFKNPHLINIHALDKYLPSKLQRLQRALPWEKLQKGFKQWRGRK